MTDTAVVLELGEKSVLKLFPLVMLYFGWETKVHDKVIKDLLCRSLSRLVLCCVCVCVFGEMIHDSEYVFVHLLCIYPNANSQWTSFKIVQRSQCSELVFWLFC